LAAAVLSALRDSEPEHPDGEEFSPGVDEEIERAVALALKSSRVRLASSGSSFLSWFC
jgi:hypothetical protein